MTDEHPNPVPDSSPTDDWEAINPEALDTASYSEMVRRHYGAAVAFCAQILGDHQRAEDIVQRGFVNIFRTRDRYRRRASFRTFLFHILSNLCINELKRAPAPQPLAGESESDGNRVEDRREASPAAALESRELEEMVGRAVMALSPRHRAALYLREYEHLSYADIAAALDASLGEVKIWIHRGRQSVQRALEPYLERGEKV